VYSILTLYNRLELSEDFLVFYCDSHVDIKLSLLNTSFSNFLNQYNKDILILIDNIHTFKTVDFIKFFNEYCYLNLFFIFVSDNISFKRFQSSLDRESN
jgi:hypothetical protein